MNIVVTLLLIPVVLAQSDFRCPTDSKNNYVNGYYRDEEQCDKYYACREGQPEPLLCQDGLVFDELSNKREPCDHYFNVDCDTRTKLQAPQGTSEFCPRLNGFYAHPEPYICHIFYACVDGVAEKYKCSSGLWFDEYIGVCNWPDVTERTECKPEAYDGDTASGFQCPSQPEFNLFNQLEPHPRYLDPEDCAKFYVCLNGITPSEHGCELGLVYNALTKECDAPENVEECKDYYAYLEDDDGVAVANINKKRK